MSVRYEPHETREASTRSLVAVVARMIGSAFGFPPVFEHFAGH